MRSIDFSSRCRTGPVRRFLFLFLLVTFSIGPAAARSGDGIQSILFHPDGQHLYVFTGVSMIPPPPPLPPPAPPSYGSAPSLISGKLSYCCLSEAITTVSLWNMHTGQQLWSRPVEEWSGPRLSPDGKTLIEFRHGGCEGESPHLIVTNAMTLEPLHDQSREAVFDYLDISADSSTLAYSGDMNPARQIRVRDLRSGRLRCTIPSNEVNGLALSADGSLLAVLRQSHDEKSSGTLSVYQTRTGKRRFQVPCEGWGPRFSGDSNSVSVLMEQDRNEAEKGQRIRTEFDVKNGQFRDVRVLPPAERTENGELSWKPDAEAPVRWTTFTRTEPKPIVSVQEAPKPRGVRGMLHRFRPTAKPHPAPPPPPAPGTRWEVLIHDSRKAEPESRFTLPVDMEIREVEVSPDSEWIGAICAEGVQVWKAATGERYRTLNCATPGSPAGI